MPPKRERRRQYQCRFRPMNGWDKVNNQYLIKAPACTIFASPMCTPHFFAPVVSDKDQVARIQCIIYIHQLIMSFS